MDEIRRLEMELEELRSKYNQVRREAEELKAKFNETNNQEKQKEILLKMKHASMYLDTLKMLMYDVETEIELLKAGIHRDTEEDDIPDEALDPAELDDKEIIEEE